MDATTATSLPPLFLNVRAEIRAEPSLPEETNPLHQMHPLRESIVSCHFTWLSLPAAVGTKWT